MEVLVAVKTSASALTQRQGTLTKEGLRNPAFVRGLHSALRAIIDQFGGCCMTIRLFH